MTTVCLEAALGRVKTWMNENGAPRLVKNLAAGATANALKAAERQFGFKLPAEVRALWKLHYGQKKELNGFIEAMDLLDARRSVDSLDLLRPALGIFEEEPELLEEAGLDDSEAQSNWVPIAARDYDMLVVSAASGRVFRFAKDVPPLHLVADSVTDWAEQYADDVEAGAYSVAEGFGDCFLERS